MSKLPSFRLLAARLAFIAIVSISLLSILTVGIKAAPFTFIGALDELVSFQPTNNSMAARVMFDILAGVFVPGSIQGQDGWTGGSLPIAATVHQGVDQGGANALTGVGSWRVSNSTVNGGYNGNFAGFPFSPGLAVSAGQPSSGAGANRFEATFFLRSGSAVADGSNIEVDLGTVAGNDRNSFLAFTNRADADGGLQLRVSEPDGVTGNFLPTQIIATGLSRTTWHRIDILALFYDGVANDTFQVTLDGVVLTNPLTLGTTFGTFEGFRNGIGAPYELSNRLFWRSGAAPSAFGAFSDTGAQGFFFDNVGYKASTQANPSVSLASYAAGFEPISTTVVVDDDGQATEADCNAATPSFSTITAAAIAANPGDTVKVCPGTYPDLVVVNKALTILGAQAGVDGRDPGRTGLPATESVVTGTGNSGRTSFLVTASDVTIDGFTVQDNTNVNAFGAGIVVAPAAAGTDILNNIIQNNIVGIIPANNSAVNQATIRRNLIRNNNNPGSASGTGIYTDQFSSGGTLTNLLIDNNRFSGHADAGIDFSSTTTASQTNITVSNNEFNGDARALLAFNLQSSSITGNLIRNSTSSGTADLRLFEGNSNLSITCNLMFNGAGHGMRISNLGTGSPNATTILFNNNNIGAYAGNGVEVDTGQYTGTLNAENTFWANSTGPTIASNPTGTGESILDPDGVVDYNPFAPVLEGCTPVFPLTATTTTVTSSPNPTVFGQLVTFTATVSPVPAGGSVTFVVDASNVCVNVPVNGAGQATCATSALAVGNHPVSAGYSGFLPFLPSSGTLAGGQTVTKIFTTTAVSGVPNPSVFGQNVVITATIAAVAPGGGIPAGTVNFLDGVTPICSAVPVNGSGQAQCSTAASTAGSHTINVSYSGNATYNSSSGSYVQTVGNANTTTTVTAAPASPSVFGQAVTFTATVAVVAPAVGAPTGTVSFDIDGNLYCVNTPLANVGGTQKASCTQAGLPALGAGARNIVAIYNGSANFNGSSGSLTYTVNKAATTIAITGDTPDPSIIGQTYAVNWTVSVTAPGAGTPGSSVTVSDGTGGTCTAAAATGTCNLTSTTIGSKTLVATYAGDANFLGSVSAGAPHVVNLQITGTIRDGQTLATVSGVTVNLTGCGSATTTSNASGVYTFAGQFTGTCRISPIPISEPLLRIYPSVTTNIANADFLIFSILANFPRRVSFPTQFVTPGAAGSMPVILNSLGNEASVAFSFTYDINPFAQPPTVVCGANAPGCTVTQNNSILGKVGVTITAAGGGVFTRPDGTPSDGAEEGSPELTVTPKEIAKINFQTLATALPSTDFVLGDSPTTTAITEVGTNDPLFGLFIEPARVVFAQGKEGDVATRNAGNGTVDATDVVQVRRFVTGLDIPVTTHNEFQRADVAPAATKGDGILDATDVIQARRYGAGLDAAPSAGGPGLLVPAVAPPPAPERSAVSREITVGSTNAATGNRISVPVELKASGDETAMSFTLRYDETRLGKPEVTLANALAGVTLTYNADEAGLIRILIDASSPITSKASREAMQLLDVSFNVASTAPSGETRIEIEDGVVSDNNARALDARYEPGTVTIFGPNPQDDGKGEKTTRRTAPPEEFDIISEWTRSKPIVIVRRRDQ